MTEKIILSLDPAPYESFIAGDLSTCLAHSDLHVQSLPDHGGFVVIVPVTDGTARKMACFVRELDSVTTGIVVNAEEPLSST